MIDIIAPPAWMERASCAQLPVEMADYLFYPPAGNANIVVRQETARLCGRCPVRQQCHDAAHELSNGYGVWGGEHAHDFVNVEVDSGEAA